MRRLSVLLLCGASLSASGPATAPHIKAAQADFDAARTASSASRFEDAIALYQKAIQIEPTYMEAYRGLVDACLKSDRQLQAGAAITKLLEIEPASIPDRVQLADILMRRHETERALAQYSIVLRQQPSNRDALLGFAAAASKMGMKDRAAEALERGRHLYPLDTRFHDTRFKDKTGDSTSPRPPDSF